MMYENDNEIIAQALNMWANHIETGKVTTSAIDAEKSEQDWLCVKPLTMEQMKFIIRLRELSIKTLGNDVT